MVDIIWKDEILRLTVTQQVSVQETSDVTQHKMEFGSDVADNIVNRNKKYSFNGVISKWKSITISQPETQDTVAGQSGQVGANQRSLPDFFSLLDQIRNAREFVSFYFDPDVHGSSIENCVITSISYSRDSQHSNAYLISMTLEQARLSERAGRFERREQLRPDDTEPQRNGSVTPTQEDPTGTVVKRAVDGVIGLVGGGGG